MERILIFVYCPECVAGLNRYSRNLIWKLSDEIVSVCGDEIRPIDNINYYAFLDKLSFQTTQVILCNLKGSPFCDFTSVEDTLTLFNLLTSESKTNSIITGPKERLQEIGRLMFPESKIVQKARKGYAVKIGFKHIQEISPFSG